MRTFYLVIIFAFGALLIYASTNLPFRGPDSELSRLEKTADDKVLLAAYYIKNAYRETNTPNMVTVVLADYRSLDTLGEETVIFTAGIICYFLLRRSYKQ